MTKKVLVELDQSWRWYIPGEDGFEGEHCKSKPKTIEVNEEWLQELKKVSLRYHEMQSILEHLYRKQQGLTPYTLTDDETAEMKRAVPNFNEEK